MTMSPAYCTQVEFLHDGTRKIELQIGMISVQAWRDAGLDLHQESYRKPRDAGRTTRITMPMWSCPVCRVT